MPVSAHGKQKLISSLQARSKVVGMEQVLENVCTCMWQPTGQLLHYAIMGKDPTIPAESIQTVHPVDCPRLTSNIAIKRSLPQQLPPSLFHFAGISLFTKILQTYT